jgi:proline dehydrogenase
MSLLRSVFLKASESTWLRDRATGYGFMRRSAARFLPGERLEEAIAAASRLAENGVFPVFTRVGENVTARAEAEAVTQHYVNALQQIHDSGLHGEISLKLTQLGLDLGAELCRDNLMRIVESSPATATVWVDMEHSPYVDVTLEIFLRVHNQHRHTGLCVQAYLFRTEKDLGVLIRAGASVRLVKGAYNEPPEIAFAEKSDVDANFLRLAQMLLAPEARSAGVRAALATHDRRLIATISEWGAAQGILNKEIEFQMLYGIQRAEQIRLAQQGYRSGALVSYGSYWFPWFMRRLAERPANALFVARNLFSR